MARCTRATNDSQGSSQAAVHSEGGKACLSALWTADSGHNEAQSVIRSEETSHGAATYLLAARCVCWRLLQAPVTYCLRAGSL